MLRNISQKFKSASSLLSKNHDRFQEIFTRIVHQKYIGVMFQSHPMTKHSILRPVTFEWTIIMSLYGY